MICQDMSGLLDQSGHVRGDLLVRPVWFLLDDAERDVGGVCVVVEIVTAHDPLDGGGALVAIRAQAQRVAGRGVSPAASHRAPSCVSDTIVTSQLLIRQRSSTSA